MTLSTFLTTLLTIGCSIAADMRDPYTSPQILSHQMVRLSFSKDDGANIIPQFHVSDSISTHYSLYPETFNGERISYELDEDDHLRAALIASGRLSLSSNTQYAWISFDKPIKHEKAPLIIQTHDGLDFNTQALITGQTTVVIIPYCNSPIAKITISAIDSKRHIELKGPLSLVEKHQQENPFSHTHVHFLPNGMISAMPWISPSICRITTPCTILNTNLKCTNGILKIYMKN